jgi:hypothetical protein
MENANDKQLSFPQRNWFLICVLVAILSPLVVHWVTIGAHRVSKQQSLDIKDRKDTSYNVASPPSNDTSKKSGDSAAH